MANPKKSRRTRSKARASSRNRKHRNPMFAGKRTTKSFRRRGHRNPSIGGFSANELIKLALGAAGGTLATKYATQLILQDKNQGAIGYGVMAGVAIALGWASAKFLGRDVATGVVAGGVGAVVLRIFQEQVTGSTPASMSGLGDPDFAGLGEYTTGTYPVPGWSYGQPALPAAVPSAAGMISGAPARTVRSSPRQ
jgi:hypothetical protein